VWSRSLLATYWKHNPTFRRLLSPIPLAPSTQQRFRNLARSTSTITRYRLTHCIKTCHAYSKSLYWKDTPRNQPISLKHQLSFRLSRAASHLNPTKLEYATQVDFPSQHPPQDINTDTLQLRQCARSHIHRRKCHTKTLFENSRGIAEHFARQPPDATMNPFQGMCQAFRGFSLITLRQESQIQDSLHK